MPGGGQPLRLRAVKGDECQCGRRATVRHCPGCGSTRLYAYAPRIVRDSSGKNTLTEGLCRCLGCGRVFTEPEREFCDAPPVTTALAALKVKRLHEALSSGKNEYLDPNVVLKAQEIGGQKPSPVVKAIAETEEISTVDYSLTQEEGEAIDKAANEALKKPDAWEAKKAFLREWTLARDAGRKVPSFKEFEERRLKGELVEQIIGE